MARPVFAFPLFPMHGFESMGKLWVMGYLRRSLRLRLACVFLAVVSACSTTGSGNDVSITGPENDVSLRSFGVYLNPETGLVVALTQEVLTADDEYPESTIGYFTMTGEIAQEIPSSCRGEIVSDSSIVDSSFTIQLLLRNESSSETIKRSQFADWRYGLIRFSDCGLLDGEHVAETAVLPETATAFSDRNDGTVWSVLPLLPTYFTGMNPALTVRLHAQLMFARSGAKSDGSWMQSSSDTTMTMPTTEQELSVLLVSNVGNSKSAKFLGIRAGLPGAGAGIPTLSVVSNSKEICRVSGEIVIFESVGNCDIALVLGVDKRSVRVQVKQLLPRSSIDRPGSNVLDIKPIYVTFKDGVDDQHDTGGLVATMVTNIVDFYAEQHPGFELRLDTFEDLPDIQYIKLPVTREEFLALPNWTNTYGPLNRYLKEAGLDMNLGTRGVDPLDPQDLELTKRIYVGVIESAKAAGFEAGHTNAGCFGEYFVGGVMFYARDLDNRACTEKYSAFRYNGSRDQTFDTNYVRRLSSGNLLRSNPGCGPIWQSYFSLPLDALDNSLVKKNDPMLFGYLGPSTLPWVMDEGRKFYLRIANGDRVGSPCWDLAYSPFWMRMGSQTGQSDQVDGRVFTDQPDDSTDPQVKAYFVLAADSVDDRFDVDGFIAKQIESGNDWLFANGGKRLRWDTYKGKIDVTFVRLAATEAQLWMDPDNPGHKCRAQACPFLPNILQMLRAAGHAPTNKISVIFYGGQTTFASRTDQPSCAYAISKERAAMMQISRLDPITRRFACLMDKTLATIPNSPNTLGLVILHEVFHALGAVGASPNSDGQYGHIKNDKSDLMGGSQGTVRLDPGNDDYWHHGRSDYLDLYNSAFMKSSEPDAVAKGTKVGTSCASGGDCAIGDIGPGGGIVFYDAGSIQPWGRYLEAAPFGSNGHHTESQWGCQSPLIHISGTLGTAIGTGAANTASIVAGCSQSGIAAKLADELISGGKSDWFLPSKDELNLLYLNLGTKYAGGFSSDFQAWSSTEASAGYVWIQSLVDGDQRKFGRDSKFFVRPVRAF